MIWRISPLESLCFVYLCGQRVIAMKAVRFFALLLLIIQSLPCKSGSSFCTASFFFIFFAFRWCFDVDAYQPTWHLKMRLAIFELLKKRAIEKESWRRNDRVAWPNFYIKQFNSCKNQGKKKVYALHLFKTVKVHASTWGIILFSVAVRILEFE